MIEHPPEPFRIKMVEPIQLIDQSAREHVIAEAGYNTPADIVINPGELTAGETYQYEGVYELIQVVDRAVLEITTIPVAGEVFVNSVSIGTPPNPGDVVSYQVHTSGDYIVSFGDVPPYTTPASITVSVTDAQIQANEIISVTGVYVTTMVTVTKTAVEQNIVNNNKRIDYTITVTRIAGGLGSLAVSLSDTITGTGSITNNNGVLSYVTGTFNCSGVACQIATPDGIADQAVEFGLDQNGSQAVITYQMLSDNSNQTVQANFTNEATAAYTDPNTGSQESVSASLTVTVDPPGAVNVEVCNNGADDDGDRLIDCADPDCNASPVCSVNVEVCNNGADDDGDGLIDCADPQCSASPVCGGGVVTTGGGGGGGGGGYRMFRGDMELEIEKLISLDGTNYRDASSEALAIVIPENQTTRLYNKVRVKNLGEVSAKNVKYSHFFDTGQSDMTAGDMHDVKGAVLDNDDNILISKIKVNETFEFSYSILITESGQNNNPSIDGLELSDFDSTVPNTYDQLDYLGIGDQFVSYIYAGDVPAPQFIQSCGDSFNNSDILAIRVDADKTQVGIGETVNYTITIENVSDVDLTNIYLTHGYPAELSIVNTGGAVNSGRELQWKRAILRSGQTAAAPSLRCTQAGLSQKRPARTFDQH